MVPVIELDASDWKTTSDFYDALLSALGAPDWHGRSGVALVDTMLHNDVNSCSTLQGRGAELSEAAFNREGAYR